MSMSLRGLYSEKFPTCSIAVKSQICTTTTTLDANGLTLHRMYIVNDGPGFKKMLWPAVMKIFEAKIASKIQVYRTLCCMLVVVAVGANAYNLLKIVRVNCRP